MPTASMLRLCRHRRSLYADLEIRNGARSQWPSRCWQSWIVRKPPRDHIRAWRSPSHPAGLLTSCVQKTTGSPAHICWLQQLPQTEEVRRTAYALLTQGLESAGGVCPCMQAAVVHAGRCIACIHIVSSLAFCVRAGGCLYHTRVVVGRGRGQQRGLQQLEQQKVAHMVCAKLRLKAVLCLALRACHDTCTVSTPKSQQHLA